MNYFVVLYGKRDQKSFEHFPFSASLKVIFFLDKLAFLKKCSLDISKVVNIKCWK